MWNFFRENARMYMEMLESDDVNNVGYRQTLYHVQKDIPNAEYSYGLLPKNGKDKDLKTVTNCQSIPVPKSGQEIAFEAVEVPVKMTLLAIRNRSYWIAISFFLRYLKLLHTT